MFCKYCGKEILEESKFCRFCGKKLVEETVVNSQIEGKSGVNKDFITYQPEKSPKSRAGAAALAFFLGVFGAHRFYAGKTDTAVTMLIISIVGLFTVIPFIVTGIWALVDFIMILCGSFKDKDNLPIKDW